MHLVVTASSHLTEMNASLCHQCTTGQFTFDRDERVLVSSMNDWFAQLKEIFMAGNESREHCWEKCVAVEGDLCWITPLKWFPVCCVCFSHDVLIKVVWGWPYSMLQQHDGQVGQSYCDTSTQQIKSNFLPDIDKYLSSHRETALQRLSVLVKI